MLATKCELLRATDQQEAARATAAAFLAKHPENQIALVEAAMIAAPKDARGAMGLLQRALRAAGGALAGRTYQAIGFVAGALLRAGYPMPARVLLQLQCDVAEEDDRSVQLLSAMSQAGDIPLLLRDNARTATCPDDAPWKDRFSEAVQPLGMVDWQTAAERFTALAADAPDATAVWQNLAVLRGWLADNPGCIDALRRYASLRAREPGGLEDAVEAEATAMFLAADPLGDRQKMLTLVWTVKDVDAAQEAFCRRRGCGRCPSTPRNSETTRRPRPRRLTRCWIARCRNRPKG